MYKYVGKPGEFIVGVPARDLTDKEVKESYPEARDAKIYKHEPDASPRDIKTDRAEGS